jgi:hypothetical protein
MQEKQWDQALSKKQKQRPPASKQQPTMKAHALKDA